MNGIRLSGLMKMELPGEQTVRLCDGGFVPWGDEIFLSTDPTYGVLAGFEALTEGVGDEAPAGTLTMLPPSTAVAGDISRPGNQGSRIRLWIAEIGDDGRVVGTPDQMADWQLDRTVLTIGRAKRSLEIGCVTLGQRLMVQNEGNVLGSSFHAGIFPGERGHDNAVGLEASVAWGTASPPRGAVSAGGGAYRGNYGFARAT
jgi:hypothetical protein